MRTLVEAIREYRDIKESREMQVKNLFRYWIEETEGISLPPAVRVVVSKSLFIPDEYFVSLKFPKGQELLYQRPASVRDSVLVFAKLFSNRELLWNFGTYSYPDFLSACAAALEGVDLDTLSESH